MHAHKTEHHCQLALLSLSRETIIYDTINNSARICAELRHYRLGKLFWIDGETGKIKQSNLDGSQPLTLQLDQHSCICSVILIAY